MNTETEPPSPGSCTSSLIHIFTFPSSGIRMQVPAPFRVVMAMLVDIVAHQPSGGAADNNVGGEMLLAHQACEADARCSRIHQRLGPDVRIFARKHRGGGPRQHAVRRGERGIGARAGLKEAATPKIL